MATQTQEQDEAELAKQALHDSGSICRTLSPNLTRVYRYHMAHAGNTKDAGGLTSQTFIAALEGIDSFRAAVLSPPGSWESRPGSDLCFSEATETNPKSRWTQRFIIPARASQPIKPQLINYGLIHFPGTQTDFPRPSRSAHPDLFQRTVSRRSGTCAEQK